MQQQKQQLKDKKQQTQSKTMQQQKPSRYRKVQEVEGSLTLPDDL